VQGHHNRHLAVDPKSGALFVGVGSSGNLGVEPEPKATIQRFDPDGLHQTTFASGMRNPTALAFHPDTTALYAVVEERDGLGDRLPSDYLTRVQEGGFYELSHGSADQRCSLTILQTLALYLRNPRDAINVERREWGLFFAHRELQRRGLVEMYYHRPAWVYWLDWVDLLNIYTLVRRRKPKVVIEFGSGCSTLMFARALADNEAAGDGSGHLYSIETNARFLRYTESYLPKPLKPLVEMLHSRDRVRRNGRETSHVASDDPRCRAQSRVPRRPGLSRVQRRREHTGRGGHP
jgi:hypothetical protein